MAGWHSQNRAPEIYQHSREPLFILGSCAISAHLATQRIARTIKSEDDRTNPPTPQIVFYQSGIGSEDNFYSEYVQGMYQGCFGL